MSKMKPAYSNFNWTNVVKYGNLIQYDYEFLMRVYNLPKLLVSIPLRLY